MKHLHFLQRFLCALLISVMSFGLVACPTGVPTGTTGTTGGGNTPSGSTGGPDPNRHPDDVTDAIYGDGAPIEGAGATLKEDSAANITRTPDEANALTFASARLLFTASSPEAGKTYLHTGEGAMEIKGASKTYDLNGATVLLPQGLLVKSCSDVVIKNGTLVGAVTVESSDGIRFEGVEFRHTGTALSLAETAVSVELKDCRIEGKTALASASDGLVLLSSRLFFTEKGLADTAKSDLVVMGCVFEGSGSALASTSSDAQIRENSFVLTKETVGITLSGGSQNVLVALNELKGAQKSVALLGTVNSAVVLNSLVTVIAEGNTSIYVCDNSFGGRLRAKDNNYFLADANTYPEDGLDHLTLQANNQNTNGDSLTDVDARAEVGVNEDLLPHVNRDLFLTMERKDSVKVGHKDSHLQATHYISTTARTSDRVIVAPGAYRVDDMAYFNSEAQSNTTVYAYGAYFEREKDHIYNMCALIGGIRVENITFKGMTLGFERQSCGQVYILEKLSGNRLLVVTGAGMDNEFGNTDTTLYNDHWITGVRAGTFAIFADLGFESIVKREDGLMEMKVDPTNYEMMNVGDIYTCRSKRGASTIDLTECGNIVFRDVTVFGGSGGFMANEYHNTTATTYYRVANTLKNGVIIDQATYDRYAALEEQYGVDLEISVDSEGRLRGSLPHTGSWDATHSVGSGEGSHVISCLFESMSDDATNQCHFHSRVHEVTDNGDGTTTVVYKGNYSARMGATTKFEGYYCAPFEVGHRVFIYNAEGRLVCDTTALTATEVALDGSGQPLRPVNEDMYNRYIEFNGKGSASPDEFRTACYTVTVKTEDVNFEALEGYDLSDNSSKNECKVLIDNMSRASNGFLFDNMLMRNVRSRGLLIKASEGKIVNCTFENIGGACAALLYEMDWGESGVTENTVISRNLMINTGYLGSDPDVYAPISVYGLGSGRLDEDYLLYKNIEITYNVMRDRVHEYGVYISAACNVRIEGNDFGQFTRGDTLTDFSRGIHLNGAVNVKLENNTYSPVDLAVEEKIIAEAVKNIYGSDVEWEGESLIPDSE